MNQSFTTSRSEQSPVRPFPGCPLSAAPLSSARISQSVCWGRIACGLVLCAALLLSSGCKNVQKKGFSDESEAWPEQADWSDFPEFQDSPRLTTKQKEKKGIFSFLNNDRQAAGLSSEARDVERRLGYR